MITISLLMLVTASCGSKKNSSEIPEEGAISSASSAGLKPITAKPGETVSLNGVGFTSSQTNVVKITTAGGTVVTAPVTVISDTAATFVMPVGAGLGLTSVVLESNGIQMAGAMSFVANLASNTLPIIIDSTSEICSTKQYIDKTGATMTGTKDCAAGSVADCTADGTLGCKTVAAFPPVAASLATAANIKSGVTLAGVLGTFAGSFSNCSSAGEQSCVVSGAYFAGAACAADGSNCFLPAYSVMSQPLKAINFNNIDITKMLNSLTLSGATGTVVLPTIANVYAGVTFGAASASTGTLTLPSAATVRTSAGTFGVGGTGVTASLADCSADGGTGCVATATYTAALTTALAAKVVSGNTVAGITGSTAASPANCSSDGATGCVTTTSYKSALMTSAIAGNILSGATIAGVAGSAPQT